MTTLEQEVMDLKTRLGHLEAVIRRLTDDLVVYLSPADKYFRPLPSPLRDVNQRVMNA